MPKILLILVTSVSGAAIMMYELLAVRILQRSFGSTMEVWAAEIAVCLAGLAAGYGVGGYIADRAGSLRILGFALVGSGVTGYLIHPLARYAGDSLVSIQSSFAWQPIAAAAVSTLIPVFALGMVLPMAIRIQSDHSKGVGAAAGWIAAVSTCGSIAGVLLTAMVLLHRFGVLQILNGLSTLLVLVGLIAVALGRPRALAPAILVLILAQPAGAQVRFETYSAYHHILVQDSGNQRGLLFDDAVQTLMSIDDPYVGGFEYTEFFHVPKMFNPMLERVLFIGLGGGTGPKSYLRAYPKVQIEVAEIDPQVYSVARQYFALPQDPRLKVNVADGRAYLSGAPGGYGAILLDAYGSSPNGPYLPYHMATQEFFRIVWEKLENGGCLFFNAVGKYGGLQDEVIRQLHVTIESVFQACYVFEAKTSINTVYVAQKIDPSKLQPNGTKDGKGWPEGPWLAHHLNGKQLAALFQSAPPEIQRAAPALDQRLKQFSRAHAAKRNGRILTDNFAPTDVGARRN